MRKSDRIRRHIQLSMVNHLRDGEVIERCVMGHANQNANEGRSHLVGKTDNMYLVVTDRRLWLAKFDKPFPAKKDAEVPPATITADRVRMVDEPVWFPIKVEHTDQIRAMGVQFNVNGWMFYPAKRGLTFD